MAKYEEGYDFESIPWYNSLDESTRAVIREVFIKLSKRGRGVPWLVGSDAFYYVEDIDLGTKFGEIEMRYWVAYTRAYKRRFRGWKAEETQIMSECGVRRVTFHSYLGWPRRTHKRLIPRHANSKFFAILEDYKDDLREAAEGWPSLLDD